MALYRAFLYIIRRERRYQKLLLPFTFFLFECSLIVLLLANLSGTSLLSLSAFGGDTAPLVMLAHGVSLGVAFIGVVISLLWVNRFFKLNRLNIEWWIWPTGCVGAHLLFFLVLL